MGQPVMMDELTWVEYQERVRAGAPLFLVAGSTEQHGPHLPLGTDVFQAVAVARAAAERVGGIVAPPLAYGYKSQPKSGGGQQFPGTTSLDGQTLVAVVRDLLREFLRHGVRRIVVVDGHYENAMFLTEGIDLALRETGVSDAKAVVVHWWELIPPGTVDAIFAGEFPGWALEHAAVVETSVTAAVRPDLVRWDRLVDDRADRQLPYEIYPPPSDVVPPSGVLSPARRASAAHGRRIVEEVVQALVEIVRTEFGLAG
ncbi:MAG: creatininase [Armatimonadota bacterium]|nr:creatininase [Armatimonadota bacterium]MDR7448553.1 creatininase [Armatimonadota bacterium]MDR7458917.1 creatininase [Armatimonadota bacterium]MDR7478935.1 creatininase [Armatimonadota bacterium]MDR7488333.1 creatininase [Armatimonadota bacterium]